MIFLLTPSHDLPGPGSKRIKAVFQFRMDIVHEWPCVSRTILPSVLNAERRVVKAAPAG